MITLQLLLIIVICASGYYTNVLPEKVYYNLNDAEDLFAEFIAKFNKTYSNNAEKQYRFEIFQEGLRDINKLNAQYPKTLFGINEFTDLAFVEFHRRFMGLNPGHPVDRSRYVPVGNAPASLDYRQKGYVTEVKNQKDCNSCYVFSAIGAIEGQHAMKHSQLISLSEQQGLDCSPGDCTIGGRMEDVMQHLAVKGGCVREEAYPYTGVKGSCKTDSSKVVVKVTKGEKLNIGDEASLQDALANYGPLSIGINGCPDFKHYTGGIFYAACPGNDYGHAVLLVGYGKDGDKYWIIKNSWGTDWGEKGYMRMALGNSLCGIGRDVVKAEVA